MNWLVTGGAGFIGSALIQLLENRGEHSVRVLDDLSARNPLSSRARNSWKIVRPEDLHRIGDRGAGLVELVQGDVRDQRLAISATKGADIVVHLAANAGVADSVEAPISNCWTNVVGTLNYLEAARANGVQRFVFASSSAAVGNRKPPIREDMTPEPASPYGASKLSGEAYCSAYSEAYGLKSVVLRFANVYGPGSSRKESVVATLARKILNGAKIDVHGDGLQTRDFIYVDDVADAIYAAATRTKIGSNVFQIGTGAETSILELCSRVRYCVGSLGLGEVSIARSETRTGDVRRSYSDTRKAQRMLGWAPKVSLDEGLARTLEWFAAHEDMRAFTSAAREPCAPQRISS